MKRSVLTVLVVLTMTLFVKAQTDNLFNAPDNLSGGLDETSNGVVGAIGGTVDVSSLGGVTYTVPIQLPEGIQGIQPNLSIVYNSQSGNGLLGWGWNLGGVSAITRVGKTLYHDQVMEGVDFDDDRFALDGQRLMEVDGNYGANGAEYRTEIDGMSKIVSYSEGNLSPSYFKVWRSDGTVAYYGNSTDSKVMLNETDNVCLWLLNRVEDRNGNYMTYHYITSSTSYRLDKIKYTGNSEANMGPMFIVQFNYETRHLESEEKRFIGQNEVNLNRLLKSIDIKKWLGQDNVPVIYSYDFVYKQRHDGIGNYGRFFYDQLIEIQNVYYDYNETPTVAYHYNPTVITYGEYPSVYNGNGSSLTEGYKTAIQITGGGYRGLHKFVGDFNGDGLSDFVTVHDEDTIIRVRVFINKGNNKTDTTPNYLQFEKQSEWQYNSNQFSTVRKVHWVYICDFDGDGMDDIIVHAQSRYYTDFLKTEFLDFFKSGIDNNGTFEANRITTQCYHNMRSQKHINIVTGDFMGRAKSDIIVQRPKNVLGNHVSFYYIEYDNTIGGFTEDESDGSYLYYDRLATGDFDGDGRTEIIEAGEEHVRMVKIQKDYGNQSGYGLTELVNLDHWGDDMVPFVGDFNGDGISDVLVNNGINWYVTLFGAPETYGYFSYNVHEILYNITNHTAPYYGYNISDQLTNMGYYITVGDINGDGKSDVVTIDDDWFHVIYGPVLPGPRTFYGHFAMQYDKEVSAVGLTNSGESGVFALCIGNFFGQENQAIMDLVAFSVPPLSAYYGVSSITDGMGNRTEFDYGYLVHNPYPNIENIYTLVHDAENHERDIFAVALPMKAVKKTTSYNRLDSICNPNQYMKTCNEYKYEGVLVHRKGKGILGLTTNSVESYTDGSPYHNYVLRNYNTNMMGNHCAASLVTEKKYQKKVQNGFLKRVSELSFTYDKHVHTQNSKVYMPLLTDRITDFYSIDCQVNGIPQFLKREITHVDYGIGQNNCIGSKSQFTATTTNQNINNYQGCEFLGEWSMEEFVNDINNWLVQMPFVVDIGNGLFLNECFYYYDAEKPHQLNYIIRFPGQNYQSNLATRTYFTYDVAGNVLTKTTSGENDANLTVRKTKYEYSGYRLLHKKREWLDENQGLYYDTKYYYDPYFNFVTKEVNCRGQETLYEQDPLGINCTITSPNGIVTRTQTGWLPDNNGIYKWSYTVGGAPTKTCYDLKGVIQKEETYGFDESQTIVKHYYYNNLGQLKEEEEAHTLNTSPQVTHYTYDDYNRLRKTVYPNGNIERILHDSENGFKTSIKITAGNDERITTQQVNAIGLVTTSWDEAGNTVDYTYTQDGLLETATVNNDPNTTVIVRYDEARNRNRLYDPDYCGNGNDAIYVYDAYGQMISQTTPKGNVTVYTYDALGRRVTRTEGSDITTWTYYNSNGASESDYKGLLKEVNINGTQEKTTYGYDPQTRRLTTVTECINNHSYSPTLYTYNVNGKIASVRYPSSYMIKKNYTSTGHLLQITDADDGNLWTTVSKNGYGQVTEYSTGDGIFSLKGVLDYYDDTHLLKNQLVTNQNNEKIHQFNYSYDKFCNLASRSTVRHGGIKETFGYDELNRLTQSTVTYQGLTYTSGITYDDNDFGSIKSKTPAYSGAPSIVNAQYGIDGRPHAVSEAVMSDNVFPTDKLQTEYTSFDKLSTVTQYNDNGLVERTLSYTYGYDHQRVSMVENTGSSHTISRKYVGNCEFRVDPDQTRTLTYLSGPLGVFAVFEQRESLFLDGPGDNGDPPETVEKLHYLFTDHLGSITTITNEKGVIEQEISYDAWGNLRSPYTWSSAFQGTPMFDRGFTGHEHLYGFGLINMNGRMYDPVMSCFLSPDNYIQSPDNSQSFNRYAYCLNNPLRYVDPSGEFLTWSINQYGFSIGLNFTPAGIPLGFGVNVSWANGGSIGFYGEVAYRVGGTGLGAGFGVQVGYDYNFALGGSFSSSGFGFASFGCFSVGGNGSYTYSLDSRTGFFGWGVNAGIGLYYNSNMNAYYGGGLSVGYGSGGWTFGASGYYNRMQKSVTTYGETVSVASEDIPAIKQQYADDCLETVLRWQESTGFGAEVLTDQQLAQCLVAGDGDFDGNWFGKSGLNYQKAKQCGFAYYEEGKVPNAVLDEALIKMKNQKGRVIINETTKTGGHSVGIKSITETKHTNIWGRTTSGYKVVVMDPFYGQYRVESRYNIISSKGISIFYY